MLEVFKEVMQTKLNQYTINYTTHQEYHQLKREIFGKKPYYFEADNDTPIIVDAGANIGLATFYFKSLYPKAKITAIEPYPPSFKLLKQNVFENKLEDINLIQAALWPKKLDRLKLHVDQTKNRWHSTAGIMPGGWTSKQQTQFFYTPTITLSQVIENLGIVDLIKLDIEGAEGRVLKQALPKLNQVKQIICEYHPTIYQADKTLNMPLIKLVQLLEKTGFEVQVLKNHKPIDPIKAKNSLVMIQATK